MNIVEVIPVARGITRETLSYFTGMAIHPGAVVSVPLRKRTVPGIVVSVEPAEEVKTKIRTSEFAIRKIAAKRPTQLLLPDFIRAAKECARFCGTTTGAVLHVAVPSSILECASACRAEETRDTLATVQTPSERLVLQAEENYRFATYKSLIREEFARGSSVFLCVPTIPDGERIASLFGKGIESYTFLFHGSLSKRELVKRWKAALSSDHPILVIGTGQFLSLPRRDIGTYIVEREHSGSHKTLIRPFIDFRLLAEHLARERRARFILADFPLRIETMWRFRTGEFEERTPLKLRVASTATQELVDMRTPAGDGERKFDILSDELKGLIHDASVHNRHVFLFAARRGLSPTTVCKDCGTTVSCGRCGTPLTLHKTHDENLYICHACGYIRGANDTCETCGGWRLEALGIGIQRIEEELRTLFPETPVIVLDRDSVKTHKQAQTAVERFYATPGAVLLGTEMSLLYVCDEPVEYSAIVSIDSLLSLPEWRISEKIFSIVLRIAEKTNQRFLIQTRKPDHPVLEYALRGNIVDMYRNEIELREKFGYPPFSVIVKFSATGTPARVRKEMDKLETLLGPHGVQVYGPSLENVQGRFTLHGIMRVPRDRWPDPELLALIGTLSPAIAVRIDPDSLL
jgi:primosomal protein N' (replication factor Y)